MSIESVIPSNQLILCRPLLLMPSIFPSIRVFSNESALCIRWPIYRSFRFNISPSNEHSGLICFRMDWLDLLAVQGTLKCLLQHHRSKHPFFHALLSLWSNSQCYLGSRFRSESSYVSVDPGTPRSIQGSSVVGPALKTAWGGAVGLTPGQGGGRLGPHFQGGGGPQRAGGVGGWPVFSRDFLPHLRQGDSRCQHRCRGARQGGLQGGRVEETSPPPSRVLPAF